MKPKITLLAALILLIGLSSDNAWATSLSESHVGFPYFVDDFGSVGSLATANAGAELASAFVIPVNGAMGARVIADTAAEVRASASHTDDWFCTSGCGAIAPPAIAATIGFNATLSPHIGFIDLEARYTIGADVFTFGAFADSTPLDVNAAFNGEPIDVVVSTDAAGNVHLSANFRRTFICPCSSNGDGPVFSDAQSMSIVLEGKGFVDAAHTFTVALTPLDPGVVFTSADGRVAGSAPSDVPVPEPASLLLLASGLVPLSRRLRRRA